MWRSNISMLTNVCRLPKDKMQILNSKPQIESFENLHHANFVWGGDKDLELLKENLEKIGFVTKANPDYLERNFAVFGIDEARELSLWAALKSISGEKKIATITAGSITHEAQNALLKVFEEPTPGTYFFVFLPNAGGVLGTVLSRVRVYNGFVSLTLKAKVNFDKLPLIEKMQFIKKLSKGEDKDSLRQAIKSLPENLENKDGFGKAKKILISKHLVSLRGSSPKMLLEWLATSL